MDKKEDKEASRTFTILAICLIAIAFIVIRGCVQGTIAAFKTEGIGTWLLVIGGIALFVFLVMKADRGGK